MQMGDTVSEALHKNSLVLQFSMWALLCGNHNKNVTFLGWVYNLEFASSNFMKCMESVSLVIKHRC